MRLFQNMRLTAKLFLTPALLILLICAMAATALRALDRSAATLNEFSTIEFRRQLAASSLSHELADAQGGLYHLLALLSNSADKEAAQSLSLTIAARINKIGQLLQEVEDVGLPAETRGAIAIAGRELSAYSVAAHDVINMAQVDLATAMLLMSKTELHFMKFYTFVSELEQISHKKAEAALNNAAISSAKARLTFIMLMGLALAIGGIVSIFLGRAVARSILYLTRAMKSLAEGNTAQPIQETDRLDEIGGMARALETFRKNAIAAAELAERAARAENERRQNQKIEAIGRLAGGIAHEINTPIQYISANLQFFDEFKASLERVLECVDGLIAVCAHEKTYALERENLMLRRSEADLDYLLEEYPRAVRQSLDGIGQIRSLVVAMKEFATPPSGKREAIDINHLLQNSTAICRAEWGGVATLDWDVDSNLGAIQGFAGELGQAFLNIITNATEAIKSSRTRVGLGSIAVRTRPVDHGVEIVIQDNGVGMTEDVCQKMFDPFFTTKDVGEGMGQGLTLVHDVIVRKHGGRIDVVSKPGEGTRITITLPAVQALAA